METRTAGRRARSAGFTTMELVVVLGIIGVLMGLLTPVITRARRAMRMTQCKHNLRQIFQGYKMYTNDSRGTKPMVTNRPSLELNNLPTIVDVLEQYTARSVFRCPMDHMGFFENDESSYEFNIRSYGRLADEALSFGRGRTRTIDPANTPAFFDYECFHGKKDSGHAKNAVFGDGHVEQF